MKLSVIITACLILLLVSAAGWSQEESEGVFVGTSHTLQSHVLDEERTINVWLPADYSVSDSRYLVYYQLDGENGQLFAKALSTLNELAGGRIPPFILISIVNTDRARDMIPAYGDSEGGADRFLEFVKTELIPYVDTKFRTEDFRVLSGHSTSALFVTYAMLEEPELFDAWFASSPMLGYRHELIHTLLDKRLADGSIKSEFLHIIHGKEDYSQVLDFLPAIANKIRTSETAPEFECELVESEGHVPFMSYFNALVWLFEGYKLGHEEILQGLDYIESYYKGYSEKMGFEVKPGADAFISLGRHYFEEKEYAEARRVLERGLLLHDGSVGVNYWCAQAMLAGGDAEAALNQFRIVHELLPHNKRILQLISRLEKQTGN